MKTSLLWLLPPQIRGYYASYSPKGIQQLEVAADRVRIHFHYPNNRVPKRVDTWKLSPRGWYLVTQ